MTHYQIAVTGNLEKAAQTCETWATTYPREKGPHGFRGGIIYPVLGNYEEGIERSKEVIRLDADFPYGYSMIAANYIALDDLKSAENSLQLASARSVNSPEFAVLRYEIAFLRGDQAEMDRLATLGEKVANARDRIFALQASSLAYAGRLAEARKMSQRAVNSAEEADQREPAAQFRASEAVREALFGDPDAARQSAKAVLSISNGREIQYGAALAFALAGDISRATVMTNDLEKRFPEDTAVRFSYVPTLRAALALNRNEPAKAIEALQVAAPHELGSPPPSFLGPFGALYPVYMRGNAYLKLRQGKQAAEEFKKILDHRGIALSDPIGALAYLQLARAYALMGKRDESHAAYKDFLTLWKDADASILVLNQAKAEYANLR